MPNFTYCACADYEQHMHQGQELRGQGQEEDNGSKKELPIKARIIVCIHLKWIIITFKYSEILLKASHDWPLGGKTFKTPTTDLLSH